MLDQISFYLIGAGVFAFVLCILGIMMVVLRKFKKKIKELIVKVINKFVFNGLIRSITIMYI